MSLGTMTRNRQDAAPKTVSCAIYTRKSTDENLNTDFNSLDSQREYCQAFVKSREGEGWRVHAEEYNDPGFSGGNMDRPALKKLLADAQQKKFQVVVCYKYDRLSRNTKDFLDVLEIFDRHGVAFVSVTQPIDTTSSVGRLMRSILMDFAQFEREMISERTRDKLAGMARKGKRTGGQPILGYDIDQEKKGLKINEEEKKQVLEMFKLYLSTRSLSGTAKVLNERGYRMKKWVTRNGRKRGGGRFNKMTVCNLLRNPLYIGKITHRGELFKGEHEGIVPDALFEDTGALLKKNGSGKLHKNGFVLHHNFILRGLLRCASCGTSMNPHSGFNQQGTMFFYYRCLSVSKLDKTACRVRSVPAKAIEEHVIRRLEVLSQNKELVEKVVAAAQTLSTQDLPLKKDERRLQMALLSRAEVGVKNLMTHLAQEAANSSRKARILAEVDTFMAEEEKIKASLAKLDVEIAELEKRQIDANVVRRNLVNFGKVFDKMTSGEKRELVQLLLRAVTYDPEKAKLTLLLNPLPDLWGEVTALEQLLVERKEKLPGSNGLRNRTLQYNALFDSGIDLNGVLMWDESMFMRASGLKGRIYIVSPEEARAMSGHHQPTQGPAPPLVQMLLRQAYQLKERLEATYDLTQTDLARELGINRVRVTQMLNLLRLAPEIQQYILAMPPTTTKRAEVTENKLRSLIGVQDHRLQVKKFHNLLESQGVGQMAQTA